MWRILFLAAAVVPTFGHEEQLSRVKRVINGDVTSIEDYPYYAQLIHREPYGKRSICGASILSETWLLTAAHCVSERRNPHKYIVIVGNSELYKGATHRVKGIVVHPYYVDEHISFDYALLKLARPLKFSDRVSAIKLGREEDVAVGDIVTVVGHGAYGRGATSELGYATKQLMEGKTTVLLAKECIDEVYSRPSFNLISMFMKHVICTRSHAPNFQSTCNGDSGGPLVANGRLIGVTSAGPKYPSCYESRLTDHQWVATYSSVPAARRWIEYYLRRRG